MKKLTLKTIGLLLATVFSVSLMAQEATKLAPQKEMSSEENTRLPEKEMQQKNPNVGGAEMSPKKNIVENAVNSKDHTTLVTAVKAGNLVETLSSEGPFTVFAPTNKAFEILPEGTIETLLKEENKGKLQTVLTYHVIAGKLDSKAVIMAIKKGDGKAEVKTVQGQKLTLTTADGKVFITDESGNKATVTIADVYQSNGVIHVVDAVLLPKM